MKNTGRKSDHKDGRLYSAILSLFILTLVNGGFMHGQDRSWRAGNVVFRITGGLGMSSPAAVSASTTLSFQHANQLYMFRVIKRNELAPYPSLIEPLESDREVSLLYGLATRSSIWYASAAAGVGVLEGIRRGKSQGFLRYEKQSFATVGVPLDCQLFVNAFSFIGVGITGFANINPVKSYAGANLCLQIRRF